MSPDFFAFVFGGIIVLAVGFLVTGNPSTRNQAKQRESAVAKSHSKPEIRERTDS